MKNTVLLLASALVFGVPAGTTPLTSVAAAATKMSSEEFVTKAANGGLFEVQSSQIAEQKAQNSDVKAFAQRMVADHSKANRELKTTAESAGKGLIVPPTMDAKHQGMVDQLNQASGAAFDALYVRMQVQAHDDAVKLFQTYSKQGDDKKLTAFAKKTLPTLKEHQAMIKKINAKVS